MSIACAVLMCHAPIVVPQIAGRRSESCARTTQAMQRAARTLIDHEPDVIVLVSPHTPRQRARWGICHDASISGSFARFGHHALALAFHGAPQAASALAECAEQRGLGTHAVSGRELDHGALVPLYFLREAGFVGQVLLIALPFPGADSEVTFGSAIREAARERGERWAVLASGDMSHRLTPDAPAGFDPRGAEFDRRFVTLLREGNLKRAISLPDELVERAAQDVVQSTAVAAGAVDFATDGIDTFSYEGPFGVGYCEALLYSMPIATRTRSEGGPPRELAQLAYEAIDQHLRQASLRLPELAPPWDAPRAVFVTLRRRDGTLRGCVGRTEPLNPSLAAEVADCAIAAATRDPRMPSVALDELESLQLEVSVLSPPEPVQSETELDPRHFGVVVRAGVRRGVLLPAIEGIDRVSEQLTVALGKAGIEPDEPYDLSRFTVERIRRERADMGS